MPITRRAFTAGAIAASAGLATPAWALTEPPGGLRPARGRRLILDVTVRGEEGGETALRDLQGKPAVLLFWATWCAICYGEMPKFDALADDIGDAVHVLPVSVDEGGLPTVRRYYDRRDLDNLALYHDAGGVVAGMMGIRGVPTAFVLDRAGVVAAVGVGRVDWDSRAMRGYLKGLA